MVFIERFLLGAHRLMAAPRLRDHHHHRVRQRAATHDEEFENVVEHRRIRAGCVHNRQDFFDVLAKQLAFQKRLTGVHPVDVATQGVDFTVVGDVAIRVRALPAWEGVRREPGMHQCQRGIHIRVLKIQEILAHLNRHEHSLINHRAAAHAGAVPEVIDSRRADG